MDKEPNRIESMVLEKRVKLHVFEPSKRKIWTVVGKGNEYWINPDDGYCSCTGFYFGKLNGKDTCYHLDSANLAKKEDKMEKIVFSDDEFSDFLSGLIMGLKF